MLVLAVALAWLSLSGLVSLVALRRGLPAVEFFAVSLLISPVLALPFAMVFRDPEKMIRAGKARRCPFCQHVVKIKTEICPHCGLGIPSASERLQDSARASIQPEASVPSKVAEPAPVGVATRAQKDFEARRAATATTAVHTDALKVVKMRAPQPATEPATVASSGRPEERLVEDESRRLALSPWKKPSTIAALTLVAILMFTGIGLLVRASRQRAAAAAPELFQAEVAVSTPTWVALFSDEEKVFVGALEPGKSMVFSAKQKLTVSAETPDNVTVKVNGTPAVFLGQQFSTLVVRKGEAMTRSH